MTTPKHPEQNANPHPVAAVLAEGAVTAIHQVPRERAHFRALLVGNANYFGNLQNLPQGPVLAIAGNTTYERITCVGFSPQLDRIDAVVRLNQSFGYGGGVCAAGTPEYVRFYVSTDDGATWTDVGSTSFTAHDVPNAATGGRRLHHAVSVPHSPRRALCVFPRTVRVRAILSWSWEPPPNDPDFTPVWGNVREATVAVDPLRRPLWADILEHAEVTLPPYFVQTLDLAQQVTLLPQTTLALGALHELYRNADVEPHRYAFQAVTAAVKSPAFSVSAKQPPLGTMPAGMVDIDVSQVVAAILATQGNTTYEELRCVGLRSVGLSDALVAVFRIKRPAGYSGGPCTDGSREYVSFYADVNNNGTFETPLGTTSVRVYDRPVPPDGLEYSAALPVNLNALRRLCAQGPRVLPVRAVLSWNSPVTGPNDVPTWGNHVDALVLIPAGPAIAADDYRPILHSVSGVDPCHIDDATGLTLGAAPFGGRPFGGVICITGSIPSALDIAVPGQLQYRVTATKYAADGVTILSQYVLSDPFDVQVIEGIGSGIPTSHTITQTATSDGWFNYLEYGTPALGAWRMVTNPDRRLAHWNSPVPASSSEKWTIHIQSRRTVAPAIVFDARPVECTDVGVTKADAIVSLDQSPPVAHIAIDVGACEDIVQGTTITGTFDVTDNRGVGGIAIHLEPTETPVSFTIDAGSTPTHQFGTWSLPTTDLDPCGYVVRLDATDRTIVHCGDVWRDHDSAGFCLRSPA